MKLGGDLPLNATAILGAGAEPFPVAVGMGRARALLASGTRDKGWNEPFGAVLYRVSDTAVALVALAGALVISNLNTIPDGVSDFLAFRLSVKNVVLIGSFTLAWVWLCHRFQLYDWSRIRWLPAEVVRVLGASTLGTGFALAFAITSVSGAFDLQALVLFWMFNTAGLVTTRLILRVALRMRDMAIRDVVIIGTGARAQEVWWRLAAEPRRAYRVVGFMDSRPPAGAPEVQERFLGSLAELPGLLMGIAIDEVIIALPVKSHYGEIQEVIDVCASMGVTVSLPADSFRVGRRWFRVRNSSVVPTIALEQGPPDAERAMKRAIDLLGSILGLVLVGPAMILVGLAIRLTSRGPALFIQDRFGYNRQVFRMYKFRTMVQGAEQLQASLEHLNQAPGPLFKIETDPRITRLGRVLRRTSLDELPQLINVLRGDMSLVGPRPMALRDVQRLATAPLMRRFSVLPGMTGLWQVRGRSNLSFDRWVALDLQYIDEWSLWRDAVILAKTIPAVVKGVGAN